MYPLKQARSFHNLTAEADFVVLVPSQAIVLIEAKGAKDPDAPERGLSGPNDRNGSLLGEQVLTTTVA